MIIQKYRPNKKRLQESDRESLGKEKKMKNRKLTESDGINYSYEYSYVPDQDMTIIVKWGYRDGVDYPISKEIVGFYQGEPNEEDNRYYVDKGVKWVDESLKESKRGFLRKYKGCSIHDAGDVFVCTNEHGLNIGQSRTEAGCEGIIDDYIEKKGKKNESLKESATDKDYDELFMEFLDITDFSLEKYEDGYGLYDRQGANLGDIEGDRFDNAEEIVDRMDIYVTDYFLNDEEYGDYVSLQDFIDNGPKDAGVRPIVDMLANHIDEVSLDSVWDRFYKTDESLKESKTPYGETTIEDYVDANFTGSEDSKQRLVDFAKKKATGKDYFNGLNMSPNDWEKEAKKFGLTRKPHPVTESINKNKPTKINIRESLNKIDLDTDNQFDLRNLYDSSILNQDQKREIAKMISESASPRKLYNKLMENFK